MEGEHWMDIRNDRLKGMSYMEISRKFFYPDAEPDKSTRRRQLDSVLDGFSDNDLIIVEATASGITQAKEAGEK